MLEKLHQYLMHVLEVPKDSSVLLTLSGGVDSVVMTHLFSHLRYPLTIAHCNFQLRGQESDKDEEFCRELALQLRIPFFTATFDTLSYAQKNKISVQMAARELRYQWFHRLQEEHSIDFIATAHHLDDAVETVFINLFRGCGIAGLQGILARQASLIRPLGWAGRNEILAYAEAHKLSWREDSSNQEAYYLRNRIRQQLIPLLQELHPGFSETMGGNMQRFREENQFISETIESIRRSCLTEKNGQIIIKPLPTYSTPAKITLLHRLLAPYQFNETQIRDIAGCRESGKRFESREWILVTHDQDLILEKKISGLQSEEVEQGLQIQGFETPSGYLEKALIQWEITQNESLVFENNPLIAWLDPDILEFPLILRKWKTGDWFIPYGMKGRKKISDLLTDLKMNVLEKEKIMVLLSGDQIIWVVGIRSDQRFRVKKTSRKVLILKYKPNL